VHVPRVPCLYFLFFITGGLDISYHAVLESSYTCMEGWTCMYGGCATEESYTMMERKRETLGGCIYK
jgi:hypothetical protein